MPGRHHYLFSLGQLASVYQVKVAIACRCYVLVLMHMCPYASHIRMHVCTYLTYTHYAHTLHTLCTHLAHTTHTPYTHYAHTLHTLCTHLTHTTQTPYTHTYMSYAHTYGTYMYLMCKCSMCEQGLVQWPALSRVEEMGFLWSHEMNRAFVDGICRDVDSQWLHSFINSVSKRVCLSEYTCTCVNVYVWVCGWVWCYRLVCAHVFVRESVYDICTHVHINIF